MVKEYRIGILTPKQLATKEEAKEVLDLLCSVYQDLTPERYGHYEPLRSVFDLNNYDNALEDWRAGLWFWKRKKPKVEGTIFAPGPRQNAHGYIGFTIDAFKADINGVLAFLQAASTRLDADFAYMHLLTENDLEMAFANGTGACLDPQRKRYHLIVTSGDLRQYVPDLYWATVLGPAYINHFGKDRILSSPAPIVKELDGDHILLQLSDSPLDLETNYSRVNAVRRGIKEHLNTNSFFNMNAPEDHVYNVPVFNLELEVKENKPLTQVTEEATPVDDHKPEEPSLQEMIADAVDDAIQYAKDTFDIELDRSEASVEKLEEMLSTIYKNKGQLSDDDIATIATLFGAYIGEIMRDRFGGEWYWEKNLTPDPVLTLRLKRITIFPANKVHKRLTQGKEDDVWFYFQAQSAMLSQNLT